MTTFSDILVNLLQALGSAGQSCGVTPSIYLADFTKVKVTAWQGESTSRSSCRPRTQHDYLINYLHFHTYNTYTNSPHTQHSQQLCTSFTVGHCKEVKASME